MIVALVRRASDLAAARAAVALGETVAVAVAPDEPAATGALAAARALGCVRAIRLWDEALAGVDYLGVAIALAGVVRTLGQTELVVCCDGGTGAVGPALAERVTVPHLGRVRSLLRDGARFVATRRDATGLRRYAVAPPALVCVLEADAADAEPPADAAVEAWTLEKAALTAGDVTYRRGFRPRPGEGPAPRPRRFPDVEGLLARLRADGLVRG